MAEWWEGFRSQFPLCAQRSYLFAGAQAPLATDVRAAMESFLDIWEERVWRLELTEWRSFEEATVLLGKILGCDPGRVVAAEGTSHAMSLAAAMVLARWAREGRPAANVVLHDESHPASSYVWLNAQRLGEPLTLRWPRPADGESSVESLASAVDEQTIAVVATHVSHLTGQRLDVLALAERLSGFDVPILLDAAQSAGALPLEAESNVCHFIGLPSYKWLLGPPGVGFLVADRAWLDDVGPPFAGWASVRDVWEMDPQRMELAPGGTAFRLGMPNFIGMAGAAAGLKLWLDGGSTRIPARIEALTGRLLKGLGELGLSSPTSQEWPERAGIVCVDLPDAEGTMDRLLAAGIDTGVEVGRLRVDPHAYNTEAEIEELLDRLDEFTRSDR